MIIGITYDLKEDYIAAGYTLEETAEFDKPYTIDAIDKALRDFGFETERIGNVKNLVECLAMGERWDLVFNIAEGLYGFGREAQVSGSALYDKLHIGESKFQVIYYHVQNRDNLENFIKFCILLNNYEWLGRLNLIFPRIISLS